MRFHHARLNCLFFFNDTAPTEIYTLSLHDALPIFVLLLSLGRMSERGGRLFGEFMIRRVRSEEHTSELQSLQHLVCRLLLEKKKYTYDGPEISIASTNALTARMSC